MTEIVIDTSAVIEILFEEPGFEAFLTAIAQADRRLMSAVALQEASMVLMGRFGDAEAWSALDALLARLKIETVAYDRPTALLAREAFRCFGKGRHPAGLNFVDCTSYALARSTGCKLLFKGNDFAATDVEAAVSYPT